MTPASFDKVYDVEVADRAGRLQIETNSFPTPVAARFLRITIESGWDDFASVHRVSLEGT
eukprot:CAMPEP_0113675262 /NCGR_PEP_ID=MMETSP0038_2-20120614/7913_1 /TAXON_ID=2898 /ORGANISM="Cryptomonas paramecium" /LENGTH=59 /DNA_ID=CAMNT_0000592007 /DNA_START=237 /DNA_END=412 /DNA_ORIENTATION=- /assembly_acc=CAM_ASM_000170